MRTLPTMLASAVVAAVLLAGNAVAQPDAPTPAAPPASAPAPTTPVSIELEIYVVSLITRDDGTREERFAQASEARPGQTVEYRLIVSNVSDETLPAGIVVVTGPVPEGTEFVPHSATPSSDELLTEYSGDGGRTFSLPPVFVGREEDRTVVDPVEYDGVRWTVLIDLEPDQVIPLVYRVIVR
ncbi:hypothetical protein BH23DEI1_BH23DEI1_18970 [soil metagenome]